MGRVVIKETSQTTTTGNRFSKGGNNDNMGRVVIKETSQTTSTGNRFSKGGNNDNMGRVVIKETSQTTTTGNRFSRGGNNDNMGRTVIKETTTVTRGGDASQSSSRRATYNAGGNMSRQVITETTTVTKGGYGAKKGASGFQIESAALNKSGASKGTSGSSYYKEERVIRTTGERKPWAVDATNGDEVFAGRHPSDEEVSTGGNGYTKYSVKKEVKYQPSSTTTKGATSTKASKFSVQRTTGK